MADTIAACSTAPGTGAIGIIRISGPDAIRIVDSLFRARNGASLASLKARQIYYGELTDTNGQLLDMCTAFFMNAPNSYTGENVAEINCHGSKALIAEILMNLFRKGARQAEPGEFTKRAFLNGRMDLSEAEAVIDLIMAENPASVRNAASQLKGSLLQTLRGIRQQLLNLASHFYAVVDFPDEGVDPFLMNETAAVLSECVKEIEHLFDSYNRGRLLNEGSPIVILGKPNVGKSSLLNALCGEDRAIVTPHAGTTRDIVEAKIKASSLILRVMDTAGIRENAGEIEQIGIQKAKEALEDATAALAVFDGSTDLDQNDCKVIALCRDRAAIAVINKGDVAQRVDFNEYENCFSKVIRISAKTGEGIGRLVEELEALAGSGPDMSGETLITNVRQADALGKASIRLQEALCSLRSGITPDAVVMDIEGALGELGEITGETVREEIIENIFSRFCVGK